MATALTSRFFVGTAMLTPTTLRSGLAEDDLPVSFESFTGDLDIDLDVLGATSSAFLATGATLVSVFLG